MKFSDIFKDSNEVNEKNIVGFLSFTLMVIFALVDICTGIFGKELILQEYIYNSFLFITLGSFGISEIGKVINKKKKEKE
tara:strand:- start:979 stop:1218 length:240 start_codon:yes stop_codon:yes gene_type:complete